MRTRFAAIAVLVSCASWPLGVLANPTGGTVTQGTATFNSSGSQLTINTSAQTFINWQSFNIGVGETTTFVQPSSSSVVWNQINSPNASQILGTLNANGYVVLQNQNGFYVGGSAVLNAHGLVMTTSPTAAPDLSSGGPWSFNAPPPTASIINYGQINVGNGGSAFLIAHDVENNGTITAPSGTIGLYAGKQVLLSTRPDGRGLSAEVTLPEGSVNNQGQLIADGGSIALHAQVVNQGGLLQANSIQNVNGTIELVASDSVNLGASSTISAHGDTQGTSAGGNVTIQGGNQFSDAPGSTINIAGGAQGGNGGQLEISATSLGAIQSTIDGRAASGFQGGTFTIDPYDLTLTSAFVSSLTPTLSSGLYQINVQADDDITVATAWSLTDPGAAALLTLTAGNNIIFNNNSSINAGHNWSVDLSAGPHGLASAPAAGSDSITLGVSSYISTQNGNINLFAANSVLINPALITSGNAGIGTFAGGNIDVTAQYGDVNTGGNAQGYKFKGTAPFYTVSSALGGISTAAGGNVSITAGGNVTSFIPTSSSSVLSIGNDAGTGAFGANPGNVTITAGGNVYGHYVVANGVGTITAGGNAGSSSGNLAQLFALSLISGSWTVNAAGNIYLQEVRNPDGTINVSGNKSHPFNYDPYSSVDLVAGGGVYLTGADLPRPGAATTTADATEPMIFPPSLYITAGLGGVNLENTLVLYPSPYGDLHINSGGDLTFAIDTSGTGAGFPLFMSESTANQWLDTQTPGGNFGYAGGAAQNSLLQLNNADPVTINVAGNINNMTLYTPKQTQITAGGNMINSQFSGQNLHPTDVTSVDVAGQIFNRSPYTFYDDSSGATIPVTLQGAPTGDLPPGLGASWNDVFSLAIDPSKLTPAFYAQFVNNKNPSTWFSAALSLAGEFNTDLGTQGAANQGFLYNTGTQRLGYVGTMNSVVAGLLEGTVTVLHLVNGVPELNASGQFVTDTFHWADPNIIQNLYVNSHDPLYGANKNIDPNGVDPNNLPTQGAPDPDGNGLPSLGIGIGGPGELNVSAGSLALGNSFGIISYGLESTTKNGRHDYEGLAPVTASGAEVNVTVDGDLNMLTSTIASLTGGSVNVTAGSLDLGSVELATKNTSVSDPEPIAFGIYTAASGDVNVTATGPKTDGDVNIDGSRIAAYDGGNVFVTSLHGTVDAGTGGDVQAAVYHDYVDPKTGQVVSGYENIYGSGIIATCYPDSSAVPGAAALPGNITVLTPQGNIVSTQGGITQEALNGNTAPGPTVTLVAGTEPAGSSGGYTGNINLGNGGVIGGSVSLQANGNISGLIISRQDSTINAAQNFTGTVLSGGTANVGAGGTVAGTIIGIAGANVSGAGGISATVMSQNANVGGQSQNTFGTSSTASSASQSAAQQASSDTKQVASNDTSDDDEQKKKGKKGAVVKTSRVTVILPKGM